MWVHGLGESGADWARCIDALPAFRHLTLDLGGHGASPAPSTPTLALWAGDVGAAIRAAGATDVPLVLVGHSLGGAVVLEFALSSAPATRVAGLVLAATSARVSAKGRAFWAARAAEAQARGEQRQSANMQCLSKGYDFEPRLSELQLPVLLLHGSADKLVPPRASAQLAAALQPRAEVAVVEGEGHDVARSPRGIALIRAFVSRLATSAAGDHSSNESSSSVAAGPRSAMDCTSSSAPSPPRTSSSSSPQQRQQHLLLMMSRL